MSGRSEICGLLLEYVSGDLDAGRRAAFVAHLDECPACRKELPLISEAWELLPYAAEQLEPPQELKEAALQSAWESERSLSGAATRLFPPRRRLRWRFALPAAALLLVLIVALFNYGMPDESRDSASAWPNAPATITKLVRLQAEEAKDGGSFGFACIVEQGASAQLVVYVFGAKATVGDEAYHVWLLKDGARTSGGTFRVGEDGIGVLAAPMPGVLPDFDTVGITLEPDALGMAPRGSRVYSGR